MRSIRGPTSLLSLVLVLGTLLSMTSANRTQDDAPVAVGVYAPPLAVGADADAALSFDLTVYDAVIEQAAAVERRSDAVTDTSTPATSAAHPIPARVRPTGPSDNVPMVCHLRC